jgi:signal peptidase I
MMRKKSLHTTVIVLSLILPVIFLFGCKGSSDLHPFRVVGTSMEPTVYPGDRVFVDESYYLGHRIADGDIVVFRHNGNILIKRVTAIAGETVEGENGTILRNGKPLNEPYAHHSGNPPPEMQTFPARTVPTGEIFVAGDNRDFSLDSRFPEYGAVHVSDVMGKLAYVYWPTKGSLGQRH